MTIVERGQVDATDLDVVPEIEKFSNLESPDLATTQHDLNLLNRPVAVNGQNSILQPQNSKITFL